MKKTIFLFALLIVHATVMHVKSHGLETADHFKLKCDQNFIRIKQNGQIELTFSITRSKKYQGRALQVMIDQVPKGIDVDLEKIFISNDNFKIVLNATSQSIPGKHIMVISLKDKYRKNGTMIPLQIEPDTSK